VSAVVARRISARDLFLVAEPTVNLPSGTEPGAPVSIEELAVAQGVSRTDDLGAITANGPVDRDPDAFDDFFCARLRERRSAAVGSRGWERLGCSRPLDPGQLHRIPAMPRAWAFPVEGDRQEADLVERSRSP